MKKYHFFIPNGESVIHWANTLDGFRSIINHKRKYESQYEIFSDNLLIRVLNPVSMGSWDIYMDVLMDENFREIEEMI